MSHCLKEHGKARLDYSFSAIVLFEITPVNVLGADKSAFFRAFYLLALGFGDFGEIVVPCEDKFLIHFFQPVGIAIVSVNDLAVSVFCNITESVFVVIKLRRITVMENQRQVVKAVKIRPHDFLSGNISSALTYAV